MPDKDETLMSAWNTSQHLIGQISFLLQGASLSYLSGQLQTSYHHSEEIRTLIHSFLTNDEERTLDNLGDQISKLYSIYRNIGQRLEKHGYDIDEEIQRKQILRFRKAKNLHALKVKRYRRMINELLGKYGLGMASKEDASRMF